MTSVERYINQVLRNLPAGTPQRAQIALELQGHISERLSAGLPLDDVVRQLGDPRELAESYLTAVPLTPPPLWRRLVAKLADIAAIALALGPLVLVVWLMLVGGTDLSHSAPILYFLPLLVIFGSAMLFGAYTALAEYGTGRTLGKWLMGLRVVRDTGARIGLGQAVVRQLPMWLQVYLIDAGFALFTEKQQRAFELLSKTVSSSWLPPSSTKCDTDHR